MSEKWNPKVGDVVRLTRHGRFGGRTVAKRTIRSVNDRHARLEMEEGLFGLKHHQRVGKGARLSPESIRPWTDADEVALTLQTAKQRLSSILANVYHDRDQRIHDATLEEAVAACEALEALGGANRKAKP